MQIAEKVDRLSPKTDIRKFSSELEVTWRRRWPFSVADDVKRSALTTKTLFTQWLSSLFPMFTAARTKLLCSWGFVHLTVSDWTELVRSVQLSSVTATWTGPRWLTDTAIVDSRLRPGAQLTMSTSGLYRWEKLGWNMLVVFYYCVRIQMTHYRAIM